MSCEHFKIMDKRNIWIECLSYLYLNTNPAELFLRPAKTSPVFIDDVI